jgi:uncharacterized surface protein with fasciclin (FAS1) repeats
MIDKKSLRSAARGPTADAQVRVSAAVMALACASCATEQRPHETRVQVEREPSVVQLLGEIESLTRLAVLVEKAGLTDALAAKGPFTVFAPSDAAIGRLNAMLYDDIVEPENRSQLRELLLRHVVDGRHSLQQAL